MIRALAAALLAALAILLALLAGDVRGWQHALQRGDAVFAVAPARAEWTPPTTLGGLSGSLLDAGPNLAVRDALQQYAVATSVHERLDNAVQVEALRAHAESLLSGVAAGGDAASASQAETLLGVLAFGGSATGASNQYDAAISSFTDAARTDPSNAAAKFDLELLLRVSAAHGVRRGAGSGAGFTRHGRRGAGSGGAGSGY